MSNKIGDNVKIKNVCLGPCADSAVRGHCGRPNTTVSYQYGGIKADNLEQFVAAWEAAGGKTWIADFEGIGGGECHWYCPALPGADFIIDGEIQDEALEVYPNPNPSVCPEKDAVSTVGCYDRYIANLLGQVLTCMEDIKDMNAVQLDKECNEACPDELVSPLVKSDNSFTVGPEGNNYKPGQTVAFYDENGNTLGTAIVNGEGVTGEDGSTTYPVTDCTVPEDEAANVQTVKPVLQVAAQAVKNIAIKTLAVKTKIVRGEK